MPEPGIHTRAGKAKFIKDHVKWIRAEMLRQVHKMPEDWDGLDLRWYVAHEFAEATADKTEHRGRHASVMNEIVVRNL